MNAPHLPKVAGIDSTVPPPAHTAPPVQPAQGAPATPGAQGAPGALIQDRLAGWVSDLTTLHELTERLSRTAALDGALTEREHEVLLGLATGLSNVELARRIEVDLGAHICAFYQGPAGRDEVLVPFLAEGMRLGEKCRCTIRRKL